MMHSVTASVLLSVVAWAHAASAFESSGQGDSGRRLGAMPVRSSVVAGRLSANHVQAGVTGTQRHVPCQAVMRVGASTFESEVSVQMPVEDGPPLEVGPAAVDLDLGYAQVRTFPDGSAKQIYADGSEMHFCPEGKMRLSIGADGSRLHSFPDGSAMRYLPASAQEATRDRSLPEPVRRHVFSDGAELQFYPPPEFAQSYLHGIGVAAGTVLLGIAMCTAVLLAAFRYRNAVAATVNREPLLAA
eukprot:gnl/TRDRNA2_/TRDRNA2_126532_c1_seq2.p1 gnl/TRDRNA2_/TRDRNA2_126532_c1~~gnl/TRDRNA2_/TRDRNA2_126532_c1_seq2.p1  ORF type:complete len:257 (+),score=24.95 gnl/TRDRNA2_/TRDRNA2_126532_c1_seq2:42-773(+)